MSLKNNGFIFINYPATTREAVAKATRLWEEFTKLPQEIKDLYQATDLHAGVGYELKLGDGSRESQDRKENFDFVAAEASRLRKISNNPTAGSFINALEALANTLDTVDEAFRDELDSAWLAGKPVKRFIRFLHYPNAKTGSIIGEAHTDHSGYTFHLAESTDGCEGLSPSDKTWQPLPVSSDQMVAFGGMQLQLVSGGEIKALCHQIKANSVTENQGRYAVVCFNQIEDTPTYDRAKHGRLQDKPAGFNYNMSSEEFRGLFNK